MYLQELNQLIDIYLRDEIKYDFFNQFLTILINELEYF
jgi:hypothetical protein